MIELNVNPEFHSLIPPISTEEYQLLEESICKEGCREAIVIWNDTVLDGHNRFEICCKHNIGFKTLEKEFASEDEAKIWIIHNQLARRNLPPHERIRLALLLKPAIQEEAKERMLAGKKDPVTNSSKGRTRKKVATAAGVSEDTVRKSETIEKEASPEVKEAVRKGRMSVNKAYRTVKPTKKEWKPDSANLQDLKEYWYRLKSVWGRAGKTDKRKFCQYVGMKEKEFKTFIEEHSHIASSATVKADAKPQVK